MARQSTFADHVFVIAAFLVLLLASTAIILGAREAGQYVATNFYDRPVETVPAANSHSLR